MKKRSPDGPSLPNQHTTITKNNMAVFYKIWKKYNEIQLTKKMDLNIQKIKNHPPFPVKNNKSYYYYMIYIIIICQVYGLRGVS